MKVLIVDDCIHMRTLLRRLLGTFCIRDVDEAPNGQDGMTMLRARKYDLILTDLEMQPMNGLEFTSGVRACRESANHQVPIIMISGHTAVQKVRAARDAGVTEFVVKPITTGNLFARIMDIAERPRTFLRGDSYIGPDRRRRNAENFPGPWRRQDDTNA